MAVPNGTPIVCMEPRFSVGYAPAPIFLPARPWPLPLQAFNTVKARHLRSLRPEAACCWQMAALTLFQDLP